MQGKWCLCGCHTDFKSKIKRKNAKKSHRDDDNFVGYFAARKLQKSTRRALNAARRRNFRRVSRNSGKKGIRISAPHGCQYKLSYITRRKSHHEAENLKAVSGSGLDGSEASASAAAAASGVERLLPEDFDTARPRPNVVLIMCDDQGKCGRKS